MTKEELESVRKAVIRRYPISAGVALNGIEMELSNDVPTAAVVANRDDKGTLVVKKIKVNPKFFENLTFSQRVFVLAHEACHISLKHFARSLNKPIKDTEREYAEYCEKETDENKRKIKYMKLHKKYQKLWNIATDACINAFLKRDGLDFPEVTIDPKTGAEIKAVYMEEGLYKSAEKIYDKLVEEDKEKRKQKEQNKDNQNKDNQNNDNQDQSGNDSDTLDEEKKKQIIKNLDDIDSDDYRGFDSHDEWNDDEDIDEKKEIHVEEEEIDDEDVMNKDIEARQKASSSKFKDTKSSLTKLREGLGLKDIKPAVPVLSWKRLLVGTLEKEQEVWGTRRASRFNPNARIEERTFEAYPQIEVVLDTSGSISKDLLKGFLLQLYALFDSVYGEGISIKVGCFGNTFGGFTEIRTKQDILNYKPKNGGGTNYEAAATAFSKTPGVTKIVFTDGDRGTAQTTEVPGIIWVVFGPGKDKFKPLSGRVIGVSDKEYNSMISEAKFVAQEEQSYSHNI